MAAGLLFTMVFFVRYSLHCFKDAEIWHITSYKKQKGHQVCFVWKKKERKEETYLMSFLLPPCLSAISRNPILQLT